MSKFLNNKIFVFVSAVLFVCASVCIVLTYGSPTIPQEDNIVVSVVSPSPVPTSTFAPVLMSAENTSAPTVIPQDEKTLQDNYNIDVMAHAIFSEDGVDGRDGITAVAEVIKNRMDDPRYPNTVQGVVFQKTNDVWQFSVIPDMSFLKTPSDLAYEIAREVLSVGYVNQEIPNNVLFFNSDTCDSWASRNLIFYAQIGSQNYYFG